MKWMPALMLLLILAQAGCLSARLETSRELMERDDFEAAVTAAPEWCRSALRAINALEERIEAGE